MLKFLVKSIQDSIILSNYFIKLEEINHRIAELLRNKGINLP